MKAWKHFCTINHHKHLVMKGCFAVGLYKQGLLHDLSKYTPTEFLVGCKYYQGTMSPNNAERKDKGYSSAWLHHKAASKNYQKERYTDRSALEYYLHGKDFHVMHKDTRALLELLLYRLAVRGEQEVNTFIREELLAGKIPYEQKVLDQLAQPYHREAEK